MKCEKCGKEHNGSFGSGRFCNRSCANSRILTKKIKEKIRQGVLKELSKHPEKFKRFKGHSKEKMQLIIPKLSKALTKHGYYTLRRKIKNNKCEQCGKKEAHVHHINGNKKDNRKENIKILCKSCHTKEHYQIGTKTGKMGHSNVPLL